MSGISSGIGLISGINFSDLIDQLILADSGPVRNLEARVARIDIQRTAFLSLAARILAIQNASSGFTKPSFFNRYNAASSNESLISASASESATPGTYSMRVHSLVANHALIGRGFADLDTTPVGVGSLSIEIGHGKVSKSTELAVLNGGQGVRRGTIEITDRSGATAEVDLSVAVTIDDVLEAINRAGINVSASVTRMNLDGTTGDDRLVIRDLTDPADVVGHLIVADLSGGFTAADLGIVGDIVGDRLDGTDLLLLTMNTALAMLNDGNGVDRLASPTGPDLVFTTSGGDFNVMLNDVLDPDTPLSIVNSGNGVRDGLIRITDRSGASAEFFVTAGMTARDILDAINGAGIGVDATIVNAHFQILDTTGLSGDDTGDFVIEDVTGFAATDMAIAQSVGANVIHGDDIYRVSTLGDVIRAINADIDNIGLVEASIASDGNAIELRAIQPGLTVTVTAGAGSDAARDLGLADQTFDSSGVLRTRDLIAGLNTVLLSSLNGGRGVEAGTGVRYRVRFSNHEGSPSAPIVDLSAAQTLQDVVDLINGQQDPAFTFVARIDDAGTGIVLVDESVGANPVVIDDIDGFLARDLGIAGTHDTDPIESGNLQLQYVSRSTLISTLDAGRGVTLSAIRITDAAGAMFTVNLGTHLKTVGQVIDVINAAAPDTIEARINDTGDGIIVVDTSSGEMDLTVEDINGGIAASGLRLAGTARSGESFIDGSYEIRIEVGASDTLEDLVRLINEADAGVVASVFHDGSSFNPYTLTLTSEVGGRAGELIVADTGVNLGLGTLAQAKDAVVLIGSGEIGNPLLITSASNSLDGVIDGVTIDLLAAGDEDVTVTVTQDIDAIIASVEAFVSAYNETQDEIDSATSFDPDTLLRGPLFGDSTINTIRLRLQRPFLNPFEGVPERFSWLFSVGLRIGAGNQLEFDAQKFQDAYEGNPEEVELLFGTPDTGFGAVVQTIMDDLSRNFDGVLSQRDDLFEDQQALLNDRIDSLNTLLDAKRARLQAEFIGLESALAMLQGQQNALLSLPQLF